MSTWPHHKEFVSDEAYIRRCLDVGLRYGFHAEVTVGSEPVPHYIYRISKLMDNISVSIPVILRRPPIKLDPSYGIYADDRMQFSEVELAQELVEIDQIYSSYIAEQSRYVTGVTGRLIYDQFER